MPPGVTQSLSTRILGYPISVRVLIMTRRNSFNPITATAVEETFEFFPWAIYS